MTNETLLETYQSVKELIANNLQEKGVEASSNDGLTTLAGKILDIETQEPEEPNPRVDIPVVIMFSDNDNEDLMRPDNVEVHLYADGAEIDCVSIDSSMGWRYTFTDWPKYKADLSQIRYQIACDPVPAYTIEVRGYTVTCTFQQEQKSLTVRKVWADDSNLQRVRPTTLYVTLKRNNENYTTVSLSEDNGWEAIISVPTYYNREEAEYSWVESEISYYVLQEKVTQGNTTIFTNALQQRPEEPSNPKTPK